MDISKVSAALANARAEVRAAITGERAVVANDKSTPAQIATAARGLNVGGKLDEILADTEERIAAALKKLSPRVKKSKKAKDAPATEAAPAPKAAKK